MLRTGTGGADLAIRYLVAGAPSGADVVSASAFSSGVDFEGEITVTHTGTQIQIAKDGAGGTPRSPPLFLEAFVGLLAQASSGAMVSTSLLVEEN